MASVDESVLKTTFDEPSAGSPYLRAVVWAVIMYVVQHNSTGIVAQLRLSPLLLVNV